MPEYSVKSPRSHVIAFSYPASDSSCSRTWRASPTTARSAWNCANEDSRIWRALPRPNWSIRLTAMLYVGRKLELSG